jgi:drug/metabolite transporter (DMT)-like permease
MQHSAPAIPARLDPRSRTIHGTSRVSPPQRDPTAHSALRSIGYMCLAALVLPCLNASVKYLATRYPVPEIVWARYAGHLVYVVVLFAPRRGMRLFVTRRPGLQLARSLLLLTATVCYFSALPHVPLATAAAIGFTSPLVVTLLAIPMLAEQVGVRRWAAALVGFAGALVVIRPGLGVTHWAASLILGTAVAYALYQILTRRVSGVDSAQTSIAYAAVVGTLATFPVLPFIWKAPESVLDALVFLGLGLFAGVGHFFVVKAFESAAASLVAPFNYLQLLGATTFGFLLFGQLPDVWTWTGAGMIVGSGLYIIYREARVHREGRSRG